MMKLILPPLRRMSPDAAQFAASIHTNQTDWTGAPLPAHLARVAAKVALLVEGCPFWESDHRDDAVQVAWLHHVTAEGGATARDLRRESFSKIVIDDVMALTNDSTIFQEAGIDSIAHDADLATILVGIADMDDNLKHAKFTQVIHEDMRCLSRDHEYLRQKLLEAAKLKGWTGHVDTVKTYL